MMLRIAFCELQDEEMDQLASSDTDDIQKEEAFWKQSEGRTKKRMVGWIRKQHMIHTAKVALPKALQAAACILIIFFVGLSVAIATVHDVRVRVLDLILNVEKQYTEISLQENNEKSFTVPSDWKGTYYPAYIPEGFEIDKISSLYGISSLDCINGDRYLFFSECGEDASTNIDTEGALVDAVMINGSPAILAEKNGLVTIAWAYSKNYFVLQAQVDRDTAMKIAESITMVKN
jgi:hypothetical protein